MVHNFICLAFLTMIFQSTPFKKAQLSNSRVKNAYEEKETVVKQYFKQHRLTYEGFHLFIRIFKKEEQVEVWIEEKGKTIYSLLHAYDVCASSGAVGPKRKEGDLQVPEGVYFIQNFNPQSNFHLSLGINYPNASDKILSDPKHPGSQIYIHGNCVTIGCIPITDDKIKELYVLAVEARNNGQSNIPVHIFPTRLDAGAIDILKKEYLTEPSTVSLWKNLQAIYLDFNTTKSLKKVSVNNKGEYHF